MTTYTWTSGNGDNWTTASDWTPSGPPGPADVADILAGTGVTVEGNTSIGSIADSGSIDITAGLLSVGGPVSGGGSIQVQGLGSGFQISQTATIDNVTIRVGAGATLSSGSPSATLTLGPSTSVSTAGDGAELGARGGFVNQGIIAVAGGAAQTDAARFTNAGSLLVAAGSSFQSNAWNFSNLGTMSLTGGMTLAGPSALPRGTRGPSAFNNLGSLVVAGDVQASTNNFANTGAITIETGGSLAASGLSFSEQAGSSLTVQTGGTFDLASQSAALASDSIVANGGTIIFNPATVTTAGTLLISSGGVVEVVGTGGAESFDFQNGTGTLRIDSPSQFTGTIDGLSGGGTLDLGGFFAADTTGALLAGNVLSVTDNTHSAAIQLDPNADFTGRSFSFASDGSGGTDVQSQIPCFCAGTLILTPHGEVAVEQLRAGMEVATVSGAPTPIIWIGCGRTGITDANREAATPIIVRRGALGDNVPARDLRLTRGHSLLMDGVLITVETLLNGRSVVLDRAARSVNYYHVEVDGHAVLLADGAPTETYRDDGNRALFLLGKDGDRTDRTEAKAPCAPIVKEGPVADRLWRMVSDRAGGSGPVTTDPDLHLLADGHRIEPNAVEDKRYLFAFDANPKQLHLVSRSSIPAEIGHGRDLRRLGVAIRSVVLHRSGIEMRIAHDAPVLSEGFHAAEVGFRWTNGNAMLPVSLIPVLPGLVTLEVQTVHAVPYEVPADPAETTRLCA